MKELEICEIFESIQGEGIYQGYPTIFIRLSECNLRCSYCDSKFSYKTGTKLSIDEIATKIKKFKSKKVCITGGEPLLQKNCIDLIKKLNEYEISIETNGTKSIKNIVSHASISLDIKCPSSENSDKTKFENLD